MDEYFEELPEGCPPAQTTLPEGDYFRLVEDMPPSDSDFWSHRRLNPDAKFHACECTAGAVSLFKDLADAQQLKLLPRHRDKKIVRIKLDASAGRVLRQGQYPSHHSWWRAKEFEVLSALVALGGES